MSYQISFIEPLKVDERPQGESRYAVAKIFISPTFHDNPCQLAYTGLTEMKRTLYQEIIRRYPEFSQSDIHQGWMRIFHEGKDKHGRHFVWSKNDLEGPIEIENVDFSQKFTCMYITAPARDIMFAYNSSLNILPFSNFV